MSDLPDKIGSMSPKRVALLALELDARIDAIEKSAREPIAIVGMACRFPGAPDLDAFWKLLREGSDAVCEVPPDRWDAEAYFDPDYHVPGKMSTRWGGFLPSIDGFDAQFFGISPREAATMDPQQRLLLEVASEALEHAGVSPDRLSGSRTGVFVGICNSDYHQLILDRGAAGIDLYMATGSAHSVASGRLSYTLGLRGPSVSVDTACSSSLVAFHLACQSIRAGESRTALACGVNLVISPLTTVALSQSGMMAPDGRCKAFDASGDGFVRGEGCGVVVLKRLSHAMADGDRVLALVRGSAANQDGRSSGLTAPNGPSQEAVMRAALENAGVAPGDVGYIETHGTGTPLGDPIEVKALGNVYGPGHAKSRPLLIGSVKTNIGHLESAAGIAGVIKTALALRHGQIPASLHFRKPNPHIAWDSIPVAVCATLRQFPRADKPLVAGVSSFGFSGTNVHVIIEEAPAPVAPAATAAKERPQHVLSISAKSETALAELASRYERILEDPAANLADIAFTANTGRGKYPWRLACAAGSADELRQQLACHLQGEKPSRLVSGKVRQLSRVDPVLLFPGQGAQYPGMARRLYDHSETFRETLDRCARILSAHIDRPLLEVLFPPEGAETPLHDPAYAQPANVAVEVAAAEMWRSWGVQPAAVAGHSLGEFAAACVAGICSLEDALRLVSRRGRLMQGLPPTGAMASVYAGEARVAEAIARLGGNASIAALNHPEQTVVSGPKAAVEAVVKAFEAGQVKCEWLRAYHGYHSPEMAPIVGELIRAAREAEFRPSRIAFVSAMTGQVEGADAPLPSDYWGKQLVAPVRFVDAAERLKGMGYRVFLDVGPAPVLGGMGRFCFPEGLWLATMRPGRDDWEQVLDALAALDVAGVGVDWDGFDRPYARRRVTLPSYPFERSRHWIKGAGRRSAVLPAPDAGGSVHPLLGQRADHPVPTFEAHFDIEALPVLGDHRVAGASVVPGPVYAELGLAAASRVLGPEARQVEDLQLREVLIVEEGEGRTVQTVLSEPAADGTARFQVFSLPGAGKRPGWRKHAEGRITVCPEGGAAAPNALAEARGRCTRAADLERLRSALAARGVEVAAMDAVQAVWTGDGESVARVRMPDGTAEGSPYVLDPTVSDAGMIAVAALLGEREGEGATAGYFLVGAGRIRVYARPKRDLWSHAVLRAPRTAGPARPEIDLVIYDDSGLAVAVFEGLLFQKGSAVAAAKDADRKEDGWFYRVEWEELGPVAMPQGSGTTQRPSALASAGRLPAVAQELSREFDLKEYMTIRPALDELCGCFVIKAIRELGWDLAPGTRRKAGTLATELGVVARHHRLFARLVGMIERDGRLSRRGEWLEAGDGGGPDPAVSAGQLEKRHPRLADQIRVTARCGASLARVLRGDADPLHLLFDGANARETEALYQDSPYARAFNGLVREAVSGIAAAAFPKGPIRFLEIGAGTGGTTSSILPVLPADRTEYDYTDVTAAFLARGKAKFGAYPFVRYGTLDIEKDPEAQGYRAGAYDLVLAANVLHATSDLKRSLANARKLLAPGGALVLLEGTRTERWVDLTFGLTEGWWKFSDSGLRREEPVVDGETWKRILAETGFRAAVVPESGEEPASAVPMAVIVADAVPAHGEVGGSAASGLAGRRCLLVGADEAVGDALGKALRTAGARCVTVGFGPSDGRRRSDFTFDPRGPEGFDAVLRRAGGDGGCEIVFLRALEGRSQSEEEEGDGAAVCAEAVRVLQGMIRAGTGGRLWLATRGAQPAGPEPRVVSSLQAELWGIGRVAAIEHPEFWGGLVDLDPLAGAVDQADALVSVIGRGDGEDQVAVRGDRRFAARLGKAGPPRGGKPAVRPDGSYLVAGGLGGLGLKVARWLADQGARHIVLLGRSGLPEGPPDPEPVVEIDRQRRLGLFRELSATGAAIEVAAGDVSDRKWMGALFARFGRDWPPLRGVVQAAVSMSHRPLKDLDAGTIGSMFAAKVAGTRVLLGEAERLSPDFILLFSSTTALLGAGGLAHYAAANQYLDAVAHERRAAGIPVTSINWGTWDEMRAASEEDRKSFREGGMNPMPSDAALRAMGAVLSAGLPQVAVASIDWEILRPLYEARGRRPILSRLGGQAPSKVRKREEKKDLRAKLEGVAPGARKGVVLAFVKAEVAKILGLPDPEAVDPDQGLFDMGMDSLMAVDVKSRLEAGAGQPLPATLTFNYPTVAALTGFLAGEILKIEDGGAAAESGRPAPAKTPPEALRGDDMSEDDLAALLKKKLDQIS